MKGRTISLLLAVLILMFLNSCGKNCTIESEGSNTFDCPDEVYSLVVNYSEAYKQGTPIAKKYVYFQNEERRNAFENDSAKLLAYSIEDIIKINDNLYEISLLIRTDILIYAGEINEQEYLRITNYAGKIDGEWKIILNERSIPGSVLVE